MRTQHITEYNPQYYDHLFKVNSLKIGGLSFLAATSISGGIVTPVFFSSAMGSTLVVAIISLGFLCTTAFGAGIVYLHDQRVSIERDQNNRERASTTFPDRSLVEQAAAPVSAEANAVLETLEEVSDERTPTPTVESPNSTGAATTPALEEPAAAAESSAAAQTAASPAAASTPAAATTPAPAPASAPAAATTPAPAPGAAVEEVVVSREEQFPAMTTPNEAAEAVFGGNRSSSVESFPDVSPTVNPGLNSTMPGAVESAFAPALAAEEAVVVAEDQVSASTTPVPEEPAAAPAAVRAGLSVHHAVDPASARNASSADVNIRGRVKQSLGGRMNGLNFRTGKW